jgi:hypothetical protein
VGQSRRSPPQPTVKNRSRSVAGIGFTDSLGSRVRARRQTTMREWRYRM